MAEVFKTPSLDYSSRDFESLRDDQLRLVPFFTEEWTDLNPSDFGVVLLELNAYVGDILHFYVDRLANECFLSSAVKRESVVNLVRLIDFNVLGPAAATVDLQFTLPSTLAGDLLIPKGTKVQTPSSGLVVRVLIFYVILLLLNI